MTMKPKVVGIFVLIAICGSFAYSQTLPGIGGGETGGVVVPWSELLAMLSVFTAIIGAIQWIIVRVLVDPMIRTQSEQMKEWAGKVFPSHIEFSAHVKSDETFQERMDRDLEQVWKQLEKRER